MLATSLSALVIVLVALIGRPAPLAAPFGRAQQIREQDHQQWP
jgi:hypothetical protein